MKIRKRFLLSSVIASGIFLFVFIVFAPKSYAATWKKYTKLPKGTYEISYDYYNGNAGRISKVHGKISSKYLTLYAAINNWSTNKIRYAKPVKMKLAKNCKFYTYTYHAKNPSSVYALKNTSKAYAKKLMSKYKGKKLYYAFHSFHVKNNKVDKIVIAKYSSK